MQVIVTNVSTSAVDLTFLGNKTLQPNDSVTFSHTEADIDREQSFRDLVAAGTITATITKETNDWVPIGDDVSHAFVRVATTTPVTMTLLDSIVVTKLAVAGAVAVTLPASPYKGMVVQVIDGTGDASSNNVTVTPASGTVNGGANLVISSNYGSALFVYSGTEWLGKASTVISSGAAGGDLSGTYPNPTVAKVNGITQSTDMVIRKASKTIANAALKTMHATPVEVIAAPSAGSFIELVSVHAKIIATIAFDAVAATDYLQLRYTNSAGQLLTQNVDPTGFADQASNQQRLVPLALGAASFVTPSDAANVVAFIAGTEWYAAAGDGAMHLEVLYRVRTTAI